MNKTIKLDLDIILYSLLMGAVVGVFTWGYLGIVKLGIHFIWHTVRENLNTNYFTLITATIGGILVGLTQKYFGDYPKYLDETLAQYKKNKRVEYHSVLKSAINSLTILFFGASVGPEASLSGIVGGIITFVGEKLRKRIKDKNTFDKYEDLMVEYSIQASAGILFNAPMFGLYTLTGEESDTNTIKKLKAIIYGSATASGFLAFTLLSKIDNRQPFYVRFGEGSISSKEILWSIPLVGIFIICGYIYKLYGKVLKRILQRIKGNPLLKGIIGGVLIGVIGTYIPYTLFSGEHELRMIVDEASSMSAYGLIIICFMKLLLTEICLNTGHKGGHIFPIIFSASCLGYGVAKLFSLDPVFSLAIIVTGVTSNVTKNMFIPIFILIFFFPVNMLIPMIAASIIGKTVSDFDKKFNL